jgi:hypothetical protein
MSIKMIKLKINIYYNRVNILNIIIILEWTYIIKLNKKYLKYKI